RCSSSFSAAADARPHPIALRFRFCGDLGPSFASGQPQDSDVTALQQLEGLSDHVCLIEPGAIGCPERLKPRRIHEVRYRSAIDVVSELIRLAWIAYFTRVET